MRGSCNWPKVTLEEVTSILGDGLHGTPKYDENGEYYFINGNNLSSGKIIFNEKTKRASKEEYLKHKKNLTDRTILVSINGTLGNVALYNGEKVFLGKSACYFNVNEDVDKQFIRYVISSDLFQNYIHSLATGSTIKNVSLKLMRNFRFRLPTLTIQKKASKILEDLDNKIELNAQTNQTLEQIAQALFKSWFVDFDPVKAKIEVLKAGGSAEDAELAAMRIIAAKSPDELTELKQTKPEAFEKLAQTAALFPSAMQESELGEIP
ncbi:MAG: restriction endonuclease subunit S, partial [Methylomicrobium sp.]|nr:restriction endonuclease subunit S [Methylomicrobium sp.]